MHPKEMYMFAYNVLHQYPLPNNRVQANNRTATIVNIWGEVENEVQLLLCMLQARQHSFPLTAAGLWDHKVL